MSKWSQADAIAYECAQETITDLMAMCSRKIDEMESRNESAAKEVERLSLLATEQLNLEVDDLAEISRINREYGSIVREHRIGKRAVTT